MPDSLAYEPYRKKSLEFFLSNQFQDAVDYFEAAAKEADSEERWHTALYCWLTSIRYRVLLAEYEAPMKELEEIKEDEHFNPLLDKNSHQRDSFLREYRYYIKSTIFYYQGDHHKALQDAKEIDRHFAQQSPMNLKSAAAQAMAFLLKSRCEWRVRNYTNAFTFYVKAIQCLLAFDSPNDYYYLLGKAYNLLGALLTELKEEKLALEYLKLAEQIYAQCTKLGEKHPYRANLYGDMCNCLLRIKTADGIYDTKTAKDYLDKAASIYQHIYGDTPHRDQATVKKLEAFVIRRSPEPDQAAFFAAHAENIEIRQRVFGPKPHFSIAYAYNQQARFCLEHNLVEEGLGYAQEAICSAVNDFTEKDDRVNPVEDSHIVSNAQLIIALYLKAELRIECYKKNKTSHCLEEALKHLEAATYWKREHLAKLTDTQDRLLLIEHARPIHEAAIELLYVAKRDKRFEKGANFTQDAVYKIVLDSKGSLLLDEIRLRQKSPSSTQGKSEDDEKKDKPSFRFLYGELMELSSCLQKSKEANGAGYEKLSAFLNKLNLNLKKGSKEKKPTEGDNKTTPESSLKISDIQDGFSDDDAAAISYFVGKRAVYGILVFKQQFLVRKLVEGEEGVLSLGEEVGEFVKTITVDILGNVSRLNGQEVKERYIRLAQALYQSLVAPFSRALSRIKRIYFIPDSFLWKLPFEALLAAKKEDCHFARGYDDLPYLVQRFVVSYHFSLSLLHKIHHLKGELRAHWFHHVLGHLNPGEELEKVVGSQQRIEELISERKKTTFTSSIENEGGHQSSQEFWNTLFTINIVRLSAHGRLSEQTDLPEIMLNENPAVALTIEEILSKKGTFTADDIFLKLLILEVCYTGGSDLKLGEGMMGFNRAFFELGVENIIYSQYKIPWNETADIIENMFAKLVGANNTNPLSLATALNEAKKEQSKQTGKNPSHWAFLSYLGDQSIRLDISEASKELPDSQA